jgi:hypothetical protein
MNTQRKGPVWEAVQLALEAAPVEELLKKACEAKRNIYDDMRQMSYDNGILDGLITRLVPDAVANGLWVAGWWDGGSALDDSYNGKQASLIPVEKWRDQRSRRVIEIAEDVIYGGAASVTSKAIAENLRNESFEGSIRDLAVSAGNILARAEGWRKVKAGEYAPIMDN